MPSSRCVLACFALATLNACAGSKSSTKAEPKSNQAAASPTAEQILLEHHLGPLDLRQPVEFAEKKMIRVSGNSWFNQVQSGTPALFEIKYEYRDCRQLALWTASGSGTETQAIGTSHKFRGEQFSPKFLDRFGLVRGKRLGFVGTAKGMTGLAIYASNKPDFYIAEPWLLVDYHGDLQARLSIESGPEIAERGKRTLAEDNSAALHTLTMRLRKYDDPEALAAVATIEEAVTEKNKPYQEVADKAWTAHLRIIMSGDFDKALAECGKVATTKETFPDFGGRPLACVDSWPKQARLAILYRVKTDIAGRSASEAPLLHALLECFRDDWSIEPSTTRLLGLAKGIQAAEYPAQLEPAMSYCGYHTEERKKSTRWAKRLQTAILQVNRNLLTRMVSDQDKSPIERIAYVEMAANKSAFTPRQSAEVLKLLTPIAESKEMWPFLLWFRAKYLRRLFDSPKLDTAIAKLAIDTTQPLLDGALTQGHMIEAAAYQLALHSYSAKRDPSPLWSSDVGTAKEKTESNLLTKARATIASELKYLVPFSIDQGSTLNDQFTGRMTRDWPITKQLGLDIGTSRKLLNQFYEGAPKDDRFEYSLVTTTDPWKWKQRRLLGFNFGYDPLTYERLGVIFTSDNLSKEAKALNLRYESIKELTKNLEARMKIQLAATKKQEALFKTFQADKKAGNMTPAEQSRRAKAINETASELNAERQSLITASEQYSEDAKAFNDDRHKYMDSKSIEQSGKHKRIEKQLALSTNTVIDTRLAQWAKDKPTSEVAWMKWFLGRQENGFRGVYSFLPPHPLRQAREMDQEGNEVFQNSGKKPTGNALAKHWDKLCSENVPGRAARMRKLLDRYKKRFGMGSVFSFFAMRTYHLNEFRDTVVNQSEWKDIRESAGKLMEGYREHMRKVNAK